MCALWQQARPCLQPRAQLGSYCSSGCADLNETKDAWGKEFRYRLVEGKPAIDSSGPDGILGTDDDNGKNWKPKARTTSCSRTR